MVLNRCALGVLYLAEPPSVAGWAPNDEALLAHSALRA